MKRLAVPSLALLACAVLAACGSDGGGGGGSGAAATPAAPAATATPLPPRAAGVDGPTMVAAGDIACPAGMRRTSTQCRQGDTAALIGRLAPDVVAVLGDVQYDQGTPSEYRSGTYAPTWGRYKRITRPAIGNHEIVRGTAGYAGYFGARAGPRGRFYYSYDLGSWHVVVLNANCSVWNCRPGSAQETWLRRDLARSDAECTLAYWHQPRFSSGLHGNNPNVAPLWRALEREGAELVLTGHDHTYERFGPQTSTGRASPNGIVEFVVGTGGRNNYPILRRKPNSRVARGFAIGVLELTLGEGEYAFRFVPVPGLRFTDRGTGRCH